MTWTNIKLPLNDVKRTLADDNALKEVIVKELYRASVYARVPFLLFFQLLEPVAAEVRKQTNRFGEDYPPPHANVLNVAVETPAAGKVGASNWEQGVAV